MIKLQSFVVLFLQQLILSSVLAAAKFGLCKFLCSICVPHVDETLRNLLAAVKEKSSVDGILFQARY